MIVRFRAVLKAAPRAIRSALAANIRRHDHIAMGDMAAHAVPVRKRHVDDRAVFIRVPRPVWGR